MSEGNGNRLPRESNGPPADRPADGPPPVYVRPGQRPEAGAPAERGETPPSAAPVEAGREGAREAAAAAHSETPSVPSRAERSRARRIRRRGLLRLVGVAAVVVVAVVVAVVLVTAGDPVVSTTTTEQIDPIRYADEIARVAEQYDLDPYLVAAVARTESSYDADAVSAVGAVGLMQLMPDTAAWIVQLESWEGSDDPVLTDPAASLELGACYLRYLMNRFDGETRVALAAYNAGQGTVSDWLAATGEAGSFELSDIVYPETQEFVRRVEHYWEAYTRVYPDAFSGSGGST